MIHPSHLSCAWGLYVAANRFSSIANGDFASVFFIHQYRYNIPFRKAQQIFEGVLAAAVSSVSSSYSYMREEFSDLLIPVQYCVDYPSFVYTIESTTCNAAYAVSSCMSLQQYNLLHRERKLFTFTECLEGNWYQLFECP